MNGGLCRGGWEFTRSFRWWLWCPGCHSTSSPHLVLLHCLPPQPSLRKRSFKAPVKAEVRKCARWAGGERPRNGTNRHLCSSALAAPSPRAPSAARNSSVQPGRAAGRSPRPAGGGEDDAVGAGGTPTAVAPPWAAAPSAPGALGPPRPEPQGGGGGPRAVPPQQPRAAPAYQRPPGGSLRSDQNSCERLRLARAAPHLTLLGSLASPLPASRGAGGSGRGGGRGR